MAEVMFLRPTRPNRAFQALLQRMVELGIDFAHDHQGELPAELPASLDGVKAVIVMAEDWPAVQSRDGDRLDAFVDTGGAVSAELGDISDSPWDRGGVYCCLDKVLARGGVRTNHPEVRARLQSRSWEAVIRPVLPKLWQFHGRPWGDPKGTHVASALESWFELTGDERYRRLLDEYLDQERHRAPFVDLSAARLLLEYANRRQNVALVDQVRQSAREAVSNETRVEGVWTFRRRHWSLWLEKSDKIAGLLAVGLHHDDQCMIDDALRQLHRLWQLTFDSDRKLWYHGWACGGRQGAPWSRGMGWGMRGLVAALQVLPVDHPDAVRIRGYLEQCFLGLRAVQNDEGLFHQVLDDPEHSRVELVGSCIFLFALSMAHRRGWIDDQRLPNFLHRLATGIRGRFWNQWLCTGATATALYHHRFQYLIQPQTGGHCVAALAGLAEYFLAFGLAFPAIPEAPSMQI